MSEPRTVTVAVRLKLEIPMGPYTEEQRQEEGRAALAAVVEVQKMLDEKGWRAVGDMSAQIKARSRR